MAEKRGEWRKSAKQKRVKMEVNRAKQRENNEGNIENKIKCKGLKSRKTEEEKERREERADEHKRRRKGSTQFELQLWDRKQHLLLHTHDISFSSARNVSPPMFFRSYRS